MPRFDHPDFTRPVTDEPADRALALTHADPLPPLVEPTAGRVDRPSDDPLVTVQHRRIRTLCNYWHAGWENAIPSTLLRSEAMERLVLAVESLPPEWGLAVFDAWRPLDLQQELYSAAISDPTIPPGLFAQPSTDPTTPPPHLSGGAVDLTLTVDGVALALGCGFDDTTELAHASQLESKSCPARDARRMLYHHMHDVGFIVFKDEWWHFEYGTIRWAAITGHPPLYGPATPTDSQLASPQ